MDPRDCDPVVGQLAVIYPAYTPLGIRDRDANSVCSSIPHPPDGTRVREFPWFKEGLENKRFTVGDAFLGRATGRWVSLLTYPVRDQAGKVSGLLVLPLDLLKLQERVFEGVPKNAIVVVFDRADRFLMRSLDPDTWIGKPLPAEQAEVVRGKTQGFFEATGVDGVTRLYVATNVPRAQWRVFAGLPVKEVFAPLSERLVHIVGIGLAVLLFAL